MSYIQLLEMCYRQLYKMSSRFANPTSFMHLKDILARCLESLQDIFKTSLRCIFADWISSCRRIGETILATIGKTLK